MSYKNSKDLYFIQNELNVTAKHYISTLEHCSYSELLNKICKRYSDFGFHNIEYKLLNSNKSNFIMLFKMAHIMWISIILRNREISENYHIKNKFNALEIEFKRAEKKMNWVAKNSNSINIRNKIYSEVKKEILILSDNLGYWLFDNPHILVGIIRSIKNEEHHESYFFYKNINPEWW